MIETKHIIAELSVQEKICLYNDLYEDLASKGIDGDTELAHVNKAEMQVLRAMGGSGTINPNTGLIQFGGGGSPPPPPPAAQTVTQTSEFPTELKPFVSDVLGKAQAIQEKREAEGYIPFEGPQIAAFTPEQEEAFTGISGLVGQGGQYFDPATRLAAASAITPRQAEVEQFMSPYMQNVVEIQQREAKRQADVAAQQLGAQAVGAGGFGGSRQAILEAEQQRNLQQQLGDIQARGLASAYEDAQRRIAEQRGRELAASGQFMQLGQVAPAQQQRELTALEAVGAQRQAQSQRGLDIARQQFQEEQTFPERTLQQYQSVIRGFPLAPTTYQTSQTTTPAPSFLQQAAGLGTTAIGLAGAFGGFGGRAKGGLVSRMRGGQVDQSNGLGSIVVKKQEGGNFVPPTRGRFTDPNYENPIGRDIENLIEALGRGIIDPPTFESRMSELRRRANKVGMPEEKELTPRQRDFYKSRMIPRSPTSTSPIEARIAAQERRMGLSMADQPVTPSLETEEEARRLARANQLQTVSDALAARKGAEEMIGPSILRSKAVSPAIREAAREGNELAELRRQIQAGMGGADAPIKPLTSDMLEYGERERQKVRDAQLADVSNILASRKAMEAGVDEYGRGFGTEQTKLNLPSSATPDLKPPPSTTPKAGDEMPSNAEMAGYRAGLTEFGPLTPDLETTPSTAPSTDKEEVVVAKQATNTFAQLPGSEIRDKLSKEFETLAASRKARLDARKKGLDSDRWLAVANLGANILAQPGGQTFLEAIGKGAKQSGIITSLSKLNREEADIADKLATIDVDTLMKKYQLSKDESAEFVRERDYGFKLKQAEDNLTIAREKLKVARTVTDQKVAQAQATAARDQLRMLQNSRKPLGKDAQKEWTKQFKDIVKEDNLKTILPEAMIEKFDDLDLDDNDNLKEGLRIKIAEIRSLNPSLTERQLLRRAIPIVYGPYLR